MAKTDPTCERLVSLLSGSLGTVTYKAMFGAFAVYAQGVIFACVDKGDLLFKADAASRGPYEARGISAWQPNPKSPGTMPYFRVPEDVEADDAKLTAWAKDAVAAGVRLAAAKKPKKATAAVKTRSVAWNRF